MIYLIGGPARCGKSTLAQRFRAQIDGQVVTTDAFLSSIRNNVKPEQFPAFFTRIYDPTKLMVDPKAKSERFFRRDAAAWAFYRKYLEIAAEKAPDDDILMDGNLWPDLVQTLQLPHRAVFLIDTSVEQFRRVIAIRDSDTNQNNWMQGYSDEGLVRWAKMNAARSQRYVLYCEKYNYPYFDLAQHDIAHAQQLAFEHLINRFN